ncbi:MAG TPA: enoyl-CoA hydratase-related protein [Polyangiales bacterium]|nr:enoyl-CoA hydratase-related protein [Polyangiales bacterium]
MTEQAPVLLQHDAALSTIVINRPAALNALNRATLEALGRCIDEVRARTETGCVIVTGAGDKAFVAGADIAEMSGLGPAEAQAFGELGQRVFAALESLSVPVIAAVNGFALGGGCELALACDFIHASSHAKFGQPEVKLGIIPGFGGTQRLMRRVSPGIARELIYSGAMLGPEEALRIGLVNAVHPRAELLEKVTAIAKTLLANGKGALAAAKAVMNEGRDLPLAAAIQREAVAFGACFGPEQSEGMRAFLEKRAPKFPGR